MNRARRPPLQHPLAQRFARAIDSIGAALHPSTVGNYHGSVRHFLTWLGQRHPQVCRLNQLRREPHILGWLRQLRLAIAPRRGCSAHAATPPATVSIPPPQTSGASGEAGLNNL